MVLWRGKIEPLAKGDLTCAECRGTDGPLGITTGPLGDWIDQSWPRCGRQQLLKTARRHDYEDCPRCGGAGTLLRLGPRVLWKLSIAPTALPLGWFQNKGPGEYLLQ